MAERNFPIKVITFVPTVIALGVISFVVYLIDNEMDYLMDNSFRKLIELKKF